MPILEFSNLKGEATRYDFTELTLCRLAGLYLALRELAVSDTATDRQQITAKDFFSAFETMFPPLNILRENQDKLAPKEKQINIKASIAIEGSLRTLQGSIFTLKENLKKVNFPENFSAENAYLFANISQDLDALSEMVRQEEIQMDLNPENPTIAHKKDMKKHPLLQLRDFYNIVFDTEKKPDSSMTGYAVAAMREGTRSGAYGFGSIFSAITDGLGIGGMAKDATEWLKSWNDKHKPPKLGDSPRQGKW